MPFTPSDVAIMNMISAFIIAIGLPVGFYMVFTVLNPIDHLKHASTEIGEGFMRGIQRGINETELVQLAQHLTHSVIIAATIVPEVQVQMLRNRVRD